VYGCVSVCTSVQRKQTNLLYGMHVCMYVWYAVNADKGVIHATVPGLTPVTTYITPSAVSAQSVCVNVSQPHIRFFANTTFALGTGTARSEDVCMYVCE